MKASILRRVAKLLFPYIMELLRQDIEVQRANDRLIDAETKLLMLQRALNGD